MRGHDTSPATMDEMLPGARTAVRQCLNIGAVDRVFVVTDEETRVIGEALEAASLEAGAAVHLLVLEELGQRPFSAPSEVMFQRTRDFAPTATFYAAQAQPGEFRFRVPWVGLATTELGARHGHMIGISPELMRTGMLADYAKVAVRTLQVCERVKDVRTMRITSARGTDLTAHLDPPRYHWYPWTGLYHQSGQWGNLPEGETFTCPAHLEGVIAAQVLGDYFSERYGLLDEPVMMHVNGELTRVEHPDAAVARDIWEFLSNADNGRRPGEFAIGTNEFLQELTGNLLQDEKYPGLHVAFGNPYPVTGGDWKSPVHVDVVPVGVSIWADGEQIMDNGRFTL